MCCYYDIFAVFSYFVCSVFFFSFVLFYFVFCFCFVFYSLMVKLKILCYSRRWWTWLQNTPVNEILAIRRYHEIYTIPYTGTQFKEWGPTSTDFHCYFTFFMSVLLKFQIIDFSLNSKLSMTSCPHHQIRRQKLDATPMPVEIKIMVCA